MSRKDFRSNNKYDELSHSTHKGTRKYLTGYTAPLDHIFARGWIGLGYAVWQAFIACWTFSLLIDGSTLGFLYTLIFSSIEAFVALVAIVILSWLSYRVDRDIRRTRKGIDVNDSPSYAQLERAVRSRGNVLSDFNLVSKGLVFIIFELVAVIVLAVGNPNQDFFKDSDGFDVNPWPLVSNDVGTLNTAIIYKIVQALITIKAIYLLGQSLDRTVAVMIRQKTVKIHQAVDAAEGNRNAKADTQTYGQSDQNVPLQDVSVSASSGNQGYFAARSQAAGH